MAFINGTITKYTCPICGLGCKPKLKPDPMGFVYAHPEGVPWFINGYPGVCENSGRELPQDKIITTHTPNIVSSGSGIYECL